MPGLAGWWAAALWCFAYTLVSAIVPWVNAEVLVVSLPLVAHSHLELLALVMVATAGQMLGKCVVYWSARGARSMPSERAKASMVRWHTRFEGRPTAAVGLVFVSSAVGIPPFYLMSLVAGALQMGFGRYFVAGTCGRLVRFGILAFFPQFLIGLFR